MSDDLTRLRRRSNALQRRAQELETALDNATRQRDRRIAALEAELEAIKQSRVWRSAERWRRRLPRRGAARAAGHAPAADARAAQYRDYLTRTAITGARHAALAARAARLARKPLISVVLPVYNVEPAYLEAAVDSVRRQIYPRWELCLVDDASDRDDLLKVIAGLGPGAIRIQQLGERMNIAGATNAAIAMAEGEYLAFLDHDDELAPDALLEVASAINDREPELLYSDEDAIDPAGHRVNPHFKPDFSPDLLLSHNYITHLVVASRALIERTGGLRAGLDGAQDYDFLLRATEQARAIHHIPRILYHWRMSETSTAANAASKPLAAERGRLAIQDAVARRGFEGATVAHDSVPHFYRVTYPLRGRPLVSIVIPFRDRPELLHCVVGDILEHSSYDNFEIIGVSNHSTAPETFEAMADLSGLDERVRFVEHNVAFNFPALVNQGVEAGRGEHVVLLNNDIRGFCAGWIEALLEHSQRDEVGAVGGKLYYPDGRVQHAGVILGIGGYAGHAHKGFPAGHQGYFNRLRVVQNVSAVTGAFMMVARSLYRSVNGFDEQNFPIACNDVDFCLRLRGHGLRNLFTPYAEACHIESASRGYEDTPEKNARFDAEKRRFRERHGWLLERGDPCYNPNLTLDAEDFSLAVPAAC